MEVRQTLTASLSLSHSLPLFSSCAHREFKSPPILEGKEEEEEEIVSTVTAAATSERAASRPAACLASFMLQKEGNYAIRLFYCECESVAPFDISASTGLRRKGEMWGQM